MNNVSKRHTPAEEALAAWESAVRGIQDPFLIQTITSGANQVIAILATQVEDGITIYTPDMMHRLWNACVSCKKNSQLTVVLQKRHYRRNYYGQGSSRGLTLGRKIALICLRLLAEEHAIGLQFDMASHLTKLRTEVKSKIEQIYN
jgi:hypothetical protein